MVDTPVQPAATWLDVIRRDLGLEVLGQRFLPAVKPRLTLLVEELPLPQRLKHALEDRGITKLADFQWEAYKSIVSGVNTVIAAGTGSGKTEAWLLPVLSELERRPGRVGCVVVYPTKALARDQFNRLSRMCGFVGLTVGVYHGDTPQAARKTILTNPPDILITNPDMLNLATRSSSFRQIISEVGYFVLDDFHVYQGVFGANISWLIWRVKRLLRVKPVFVASSATVSEPAELFERVFGERCRVVSSEARSANQLHMLLGLKTGHSKRVVAARLFEKLVSASRRTILFVDSHQTAELIYKMVRAKLGTSVSIHRAGLTAEQRGRVEEGLRNGRIIGVISTPTLELGIDIGELDTVVNYGVTANHSRYVQRAGRAARRGDLGLIIQLLGEDPISQYYRQRPNEFLDRRLEPVFLDPDNTEIARHHMLASTVERPLKQDEVIARRALDAFNTLVTSGLVAPFGGYYRCTREGYAQLGVWRGLRGSTDAVSILLEDGRRLGERDLPAAILELHPQAIYNHMGTPYIVVRLDLEKRLAYVRRIHSDNVFTKSLSQRIPKHFEQLQSTVVGGVSLGYGRLTLQVDVTGFIVKDLDDNVLVERMLDEPVSYTFQTKAVSFRLEPKDEWGVRGNAEGFHALEHTLISAASITVGVSDVDLGGISTPNGEIYIYDGQIGGSGASQELLKRFESTLRVAHEILRGCDCDDGCPKCVYTVHCGNNNQFLSRRKAQTLSYEWLNHPA
ncbi:MAG: DEAD/DEAH box helicase [Thermoprotei archaeon]